MRTFPRGPAYQTQIVSMAAMIGHRLAFQSFTHATSQKMGSVSSSANFARLPIRLNLLLQSRRFSVAARINSGNSRGAERSALARRALPLVRRTVLRIAGMSRCAGKGSRPAERFPTAVRESRRVGLSGTIKNRPTQVRGDGADRDFPIRPGGWQPASAGSPGWSGVPPTG